MKNLVKKVSSVIVIALFIMGCSKDDEVDAVVVTPPTNAELIIGAWKWTAKSTNEIADNISECGFKTNYIFDGMQYIRAGYISRKVDTINSCEELPLFSDKYSIKGNLISFHYKGDILKLNATSLVIRLIGGNEDDIVLNTYTRTKQ